MSTHKQVGLGRVFTGLAFAVGMASATGCASSGTLSGAAGAGRLYPGHDYVLIGRRAVLAVPFSEMMQELDAALTRIHAQDVIRAPDANNPAHRGTGDGSRDPLHQPRSVSRRRKPRSGHGG